MTFGEILDQAMAMLQRRGRLTYSTLKRQFQLDDAALEDVKNELIYGQHLAVDESDSVGSALGTGIRSPKQVSCLCMMLCTMACIASRRSGRPALKD